jgi:regulator of protease activity HflC (stomatin/prohibitin superfamily)
VSFIDDLSDGTSANLPRVVPAPPAAFDRQGSVTMNTVSSFIALLLMLVAAAVGYFVNPYFGAVFAVIAVLIALSLKMANVWEKFVILRLGKLQSVRGAGLFLIIPIVDNIVAVIDTRIQTTAFNAEQALTKDTVPVNVDAIIFWHVQDAEKAALAITNYREAIDRVAQTSLREMIGSSMLAALLSDRKDADERLKIEIGAKTAPWGISVSSVEIRDVAIPVALQDAMSRQAQAEREKQARVILGSAEAAIAGQFVAAAQTYAGHPAALQLRAMNIIYETTKERGATILIPSAMVDSMNPSSPTLALALAAQSMPLTEQQPPVGGTADPAPEPPKAQVAA